jgi:hypothetical protein
MRTTVLRIKNLELLENLRNSLRMNCGVKVVRSHAPSLLKMVNASRLRNFQMLRKQLFIKNCAQAAHYLARCLMQSLRSRAT